MRRTQNAIDERVTDRLSHSLVVILKFLLATSGGWVGWLVLFRHVPFIPFIGIGWPARLLLAVIFIVGSLLSNWLIWILAGRNLLLEIMGLA